jgi:hypothetical protein
MGGETRLIYIRPFLQTTTRNADLSTAGPILRPFDIFLGYFLFFYLIFPKCLRSHFDSFSTKSLTCVLTFNPQKYEKKKKKKILFPFVA